MAVIFTVMDRQSYRIQGLVKNPLNSYVEPKYLSHKGEKEYFSLFQYAGMQYFIKLINDFKKWI